MPFVSCTDTAVKEKNGGFAQGATTLFSKITSTESQIKFQNTVKEDPEFNFLNYPYLYTGAGVAVGDVAKASSVMSSHHHDHSQTMKYVILGYC